MSHRVIKPHRASHRVIEPAQPAQPDQRPIHGNIESSNLPNPPNLTKIPVISKGNNRFHLRTSPSPGVPQTNFFTRAVKSRPSSVTSSHHNTGASSQGPNQRSCKVPPAAVRSNPFIKKDHPAADGRPKTGHNLNKPPHRATETAPNIRRPSRQVLKV